MNRDVQSWVALAIVLATLAVFVSRLFRKKKAGGCPACGGGSAKKLG